jgi:hypothetical protein
MTCSMWKTILRSSSFALLWPWDSFGGILARQAPGAEKEPIPIVFVPGTAGSELRLDDDAKRVYWGNPASFKRETILKGELNSDGTDTGRPRLLATQPLMSFTSPLTTGLEQIRPFRLRQGQRFRQLWFLNARDALVKQLRSNGYPVYVDRYVAIDSASDWGDGTAPLLSATAGAQLRMGFPLADTIPDNAKAESFLGPGVHVTALTLSPGYEHRSMLEDLLIQKELLRIVRELDRKDHGSAKTPTH